MKHMWLQAVFFQSTDLAPLLKYLGKLFSSFSSANIYKHKQHVCQFQQKLENAKVITLKGLCIWKLFIKVLEIKCLSEAYPGLYQTIVMEFLLRKSFITVI